MAMITVAVKAYSTLPASIIDYEPGKGILAEIPKGATVKKLILTLGLSQKRIGMISVNGELVRPDQKLNQGDCVKIFQPVFGG